MRRAKAPRCVYCGGKGPLLDGTQQCSDFMACTGREAKKRAKQAPKGCTEERPDKDADRGHRFEKTGEIFAGDVLVCEWCDRKNIVRAT